ncbi:MAG: hypothetical protein EOP83_01390 [Verrucomicrobiaceae bacterium]|nr:MAG: hypothetical protein EOP83_01390 [Verrucomicrobiaceae bacterium]
MGDIFNDLKAYRKEERSKRRDEAPGQIAQLEAQGFSVRQIGPDGPHLRIMEAVDYWPSTGKWRFLKERERGTGFKSLLRALNQ